MATALLDQDETITPEDCECEDEHLVEDERGGFGYYSQVFQCERCGTLWGYDSACNVYVDL